MDFLFEFSTVWNQPQARHAMLVHLPIVLSMLCVVAAVISALWGGRSACWRWTALVLTAALTLSALVAKQSGQNAEDTVEAALSEEGEHVFEEHEELGEKVWLFGVASCVLLVLSFIGPAAKPKERKPVAGSDQTAEIDDVERTPAGEIRENKPIPPKRGSGLRRGSAWLAAVLSLFTFGWVANTAHFGGKVVYQYGGVIPTKAAPMVLASDAPDVDPRVAHFREKVFPILRGICARCHNPSRMAAAGGLDQTTIAGILRGGTRGPAVVPGKPGESLLLTVLSGKIADLEMPPSGKLADDEIAAIEQWIADGAVWVLPEAGGGG